MPDWQITVMGPHAGNFVVSWDPHLQQWWN